MRRFRFLLLVMSLMAANAIDAAPITESQARIIAATFMANHTNQAPSLMMAATALRMAGTAGYYVFNAGSSDEGFVIVAGDDRAPAILGYSDKGHYDLNDVPEALQELMESYSAQIEALGQGARPAPKLISHPAISPMVPAVWSQNKPYNIMLPFMSTGEHAAVGCVATAMAQVMHYWQWPARPTQAIPEYYTSTLSIFMPSLPVVDFNWNEMHNTYLTTDTVSDAANAAATLSLYCAQAVEMDYKKSSSGANTSQIPMVLAEYFGYKDTAHGLNRYNYSSEQWAEIIYSELEAGRPVIYSGSKASGGHAFVCDGYDGDGMFHINWGWNGMSNGYFLLNVLDPDEQGTGGASGSYGYIYSQAIMVGIEPGETYSDAVELTSAQVTLDSYTEKRSSNYGQFSVTVSGRFYNYTSQAFPVYYGWGLYQNGELIDILYYGHSSNLRPGYYMNVQSRVLEFGKLKTSGTYRIMPIYSMYNADDWMPCVGAERNYIDLEIRYNTCTYTCHGTTAVMDYVVNDITAEGTMHVSRPVNINLNLTNRGNSCNNLLHMFVDGGTELTSSAYVGLETGETGNVPFSYIATTAGTHELVFSFNEDGSNPLARKTLTINDMPAATLKGSAKLLNVTDAEARIVTSDKMSVLLTVSNNGSTTYDEDIAIKLFKHIYGNTGTLVQTMRQHVTLEPNASTTVTFNLDNVIDGWKYFTKSYYYSEGKQVSLAGTGTHTIVFPGEGIKGDVNGDGEVNIADVNTLIDMILTGITDSRGDVNEDHEVNIADVNALIDLILNQ